MRIDTLELQNFRNYSTLKAHFKPGVNLFVGANASGKTSLLEALVIAAGAYLLRNPLTPKYYPDKELDPRLVFNAEMGYFTKSYPLEIRANWEDKAWQIVRDSDAGRAKYADAQAIYALGEEDYQQREDLDRVLPLLGYYSTERLFSETQANKQKNAPETSTDDFQTIETDLSDRDVKINSTDEYGPLQHERFEGYYRFSDEDRPLHHGRFEGYFRCLHRENTIKHIRKWWKETEVSDYASKKESKGLLNVKKAINYLLNRLENVSVERELPYFDASQTKDIILYRVDGGRLPLYLYSDGYRALLYLVADLVWRASTLNPRLEFLANGTVAGNLMHVPGVVMIDEIELHLHPRWQGVAIPVLQEMFPNVQFFITTHSAPVLAELKDVALFRIEENALVQPPTKFFGKEINHIIREVLGANDRHKPTQDKLNELLRIADAEEPDHARYEALLQELSALLGNEEPEIQQAKAAYAYQQYLKQEGHAVH